jgi:V8-like Glu-specific endopeptidase
MERDNPREVVFRRRPEAAQRAEGHPAPPFDSSSRSPASALPLDDPTDDRPVSNRTEDLDERISAPPDYGALDPPPGAPGGLALEAVGGFSTLPAPATPAGPSADEPLLDAWYASFGHPALEALLRRPAAVELLAQLGADDDGRALVAATAAYPWRCICALTITAADGSRWLGTGWLAGPRCVITAGHCLYMPTRGGWVRQIAVAPGRNGAEQPYGVALASSFRSVRGWTYRQRPSHNYGAIILPPDRAFGNLLGHFGLLNLNDHDLRDREVNLAGYPSDKPEGTLWYAAQRLGPLTARSFEYPVPTLGGESGAPLWRLQDGRRYVVGIHTGGDPAGISAVRLSAPVFANLGAWRNESE